MTALARNIGGSLGISFISTMLVRRAQTHQQVSGGACVRRVEHLSGDGEGHGGRRCRRMGYSAASGERGGGGADV